MESKIYSTVPIQRWNVLFEDELHWKFGIYKPEFSSSDEITVLEKHSCPELFICMEGKMGLVVKTEYGENVIEMLPGLLYVNIVVAFFMQLPSNLHPVFDQDSELLHRGFSTS